MRRIRLVLAAWAMCMVAGAGAIAQGPAPTTAPATTGSAAIEPKAVEALKRMSDALAAAKAFTFDGYSETEHLVATGEGIQKIEFGRNFKVAVRRPGRLAASLTGDVEDLQLLCDGKRVVLNNAAEKVWAAVDAPPALDQTMDLLAGKYGMAIPLADLVFPDPYATLTEHVSTGKYVGMGLVFQARCHHLAFTQDSVDWQIWIDDSPQPMPRKIVITYKQMPAQPRYTAFLSNWNLSPDLPDATFAFTPPAGARRVEMAAPTSRPAAQAGGEKNETTGP